ncbi:unnamed protein product [Chrysodeixis includens]|uniref:C2H2-type domain-containing protein n=1 Tax=Chrysodeixis includens TaxID=689277 RepID=A0A9P0BWN2_CHRIL|nr:unnamed protein product [Chrysodeixis includens]
MTHCCSQCAFTAQFESALNMHRQLHHASDEYCEKKKSPRAPSEKTEAVPRASSIASSQYGMSKNKGMKLVGRTSSATRLLDKLRARICRSRPLFSHPEEASETGVEVQGPETSIVSDCTSKDLKLEASGSRVTVMTLKEVKETFGCHLCSFDADRITVLDRHLLNDHKIGLESLLKLVMAKTRDGLSEGTPNVYGTVYGIRQPYYRPPDEIIEEGEFVIETVTPKIKILKHSATNTELQWCDPDFIPDLKDNCKRITREIDKLVKVGIPLEECDKDEFFMKMQNLNECMCKFVDSSNTLKKVLAKEFDSKHNVREHLSLDQPFFDLCLGDSRNTSRVWERAHSDNIEKARSKYGENNSRGEKKFTSESFYF